MHVSSPPAHLLAAWLLRGARRLALPVLGCWYREGEGWAWLGGPQPPQEGDGPPTGELVHRWSRWGVALQSSEPVSPTLLSRLTRNCRRRWNRMERRRLLRCFLQTLNGQREQLGHHLHKGPCQTLTAAQLQIGLVQLIDDDAEKQEAQADLYRMVEHSAQELRTFYESRVYRYPQGKVALGSRWSLDWERLSADPIRQHLFFELLVASLDWDPSMRAEQEQGRLRLFYARQGPSQVPAVRGLLQLLLLVGYHVRARRHEVAVGTG